MADFNESWLKDVNKTENEDNNKSDASQRTIWTTEKVNDLMQAIDEGYKPKIGMPFYENDPSLKKGKTVFQWTNEERDEFKKCANDIIYFANNYCTVMTDEGHQTIQLRDYQERFLREMQNNRFTIALASRQIGKCLDFQTVIQIKQNGTIKDIKLYELWHLIFKNTKLSFKQRILHNIKYSLYRLYDSIDSYQNRRQYAA